jgi:CheY-like chemotaxis protein
MRSALIIDDDAIHVMNTQTLLEPLGFDLIDAVPNGQAAATYFKSNPHPDIVFLDLNMPEANGVEFMNYLFETGNQIPIIIVSGAHASVRRGASRLAIANGLNVVAIIEKPLTLSKLGSALAHA